MQNNIFPSGQSTPTTTTPGTPEPIVLSSKNYMVGFGVGAVIGAALGALIMHVSMKSDRGDAPPV
jgi:ABC-type nitrate/sulfonate/bicarbonate transport system permease component